MQLWLESIAKNQKLRGEDLRILILLIARTEKGEFVEIELSQVEIANLLNIKASGVCRSIKRLAEQNIINKKVIGGKLVGYELNLTTDSD